MPIEAVIERSKNVSSKVLLKNKGCFTAGTSQMFEFEYSGNKPIKTTLQIYKGKQLVLKSIDNKNAAKFKHLLSQTDSAKLINGVTYSASIIVSYYSNGVMQETRESNLVDFKCLSSPTLSFNNLKTINSSSYTFEMTYNQAQYEPLLQYNITLHNSNGELFYDSGIINWTESVPSNLSHTIKGLINGGYTLTVNGLTVNGLTVSNESYIVVRYNQPVNYSMLQAENSANIHSVRLETNFKIIDGKVETDDKDIKYLDNETKVDLRNNTVSFNDFSLNNDFEIKTILSNMVVNNTVLKLTDEKDWVIEVTPRVRYFSEWYLRHFIQFELIYFELIAYNKKLNRVDKNGSTQSLRTIVVSNGIPDEILVIEEIEFNKKTIKDEIELDIIYSNGLFYVKLDVSQDSHSG